MSDLSIAILSDLHAYDVLEEKEEDPSYLSVSLPENEPGKHPIAGLKQLIRRDSLQAELLLCGGDLGDKARPTAIKYAWAGLQQIRTALCAKRLVATTGNHDCDSRYAYNSFDAKGVLQALDPPYPLRLEAENDMYWSRNFVCIEGSTYRIVVLNSSAYHGHGDDEIEHGRISDATIEQLKARLHSAKPKPVNILLCHHHPQPHTELKLGEADIMKNGQQLLDLLACGDYGSWIVIHGHKHHPKLSYAGGGGATPVIFAAGSLCAILKPPLSSWVKNQFYIMHIPVDQIENYGLVGTIRSWEWAPGKGWDPSTPQSQLPPFCGFGCRTNPVLRAREIAKIVGTETLKWTDLRARIPEIDYFIPSDMEVLRKRLREDYQIEIISDRDGVLKQVGKYT